MVTFTANSIAEARLIGAFSQFCINDVRKTVADMVRHMDEALIEDARPGPKQMELPFEDVLDDYDY